MSVHSAPLVLGIVCLSENAAVAHLLVSVSGTAGTLTGGVASSAGGAAGGGVEGKQKLMG